MEEDKQDLELEDNQLVLKELLITKPDENVNDGASSSNEEKNHVERSKGTHDFSKEEEKKSEAKTPPQSPQPDRRSPDPSCAICLEQLQNKSFTDSCFHMFCFTCLLEWSKVKPECPLCKQSFSSIVHNVRSLDDFDQYHVTRGRPENPIPNNNGYDRRFRYATTLTYDRSYDRLHERLRPTEMTERFESEMASHRMRYAPHSVHAVRMYATPQMVRRLPCVFRRRIYDENLWVQPMTTDRIRCVNPAFFSQNIACTHRLLPWLNRELLVVMPNNESQISFVIELIMSLIVKYHINSQEFYTHIEPYIAPHTAHFIHEFYHFATSPYDMENYDRNAQYSNLREPVRNISSPDSDVIPLPMNDTVPKSSSTEAKKKKRVRKKHTKEYKRHLKKIILKRNSMNNCWETVMSSGGLLKFNNVPGPASYEMPGPSTSRDTQFPESPAEVSNQESDKSKEVECIDDDDDDNDLEETEDDECQIVQVLKPKWERTPEIVDLSSDDESKNDSHIITVPSDDDDDDATVIQSFITPSYSAISISPVSDPISDDDDIIFIAEKTRDEPVSDKPIDYSLKVLDKKVELEPKHQGGEQSSSSSRENTEGELSQLQNNPTLQSAIRALSNDNDTGSSSWSPLSRTRKRRAAILDDSSTESCSESAQVSELDTRIKKLKLRSVVAHFSCDASDERKDSSHKSSHRRHKEKKKKKKKHKRKHRIYSSDSN